MRKCGRDSIGVWEGWKWKRGFVSRQEKIWEWSQRRARSCQDLYEPVLEGLSKKAIGFVNNLEDQKKVRGL